MRLEEPTNTKSLVVLLWQDRLWKKQNWASETDCDQHHGKFSISLTLKAPITTGRRHFQSMFFIFFRGNNALSIIFSENKKQKQIVVCSTIFLGALRVNKERWMIFQHLLYPLSVLNVITFGTVQKGYHHYKCKDSIMKEITLLDMLPCLRSLTMFYWREAIQSKLFLLP